jgi:hypothetical protein
MHDALQRQARTRNAAGSTAGTIVLRAVGCLLVFMMLFGGALLPDVDENEPDRSGLSALDSPTDTGSATTVFLPGLSHRAGSLTWPMMAASILRAIASPPGRTVQVWAHILQFAPKHSPPGLPRG